MPQRIRVPSDLFKNTSAREFERGREMHNELLAAMEKHPDYEIRLLANLTSGYRDNDKEGVLYVLADPLILRAFDEMGVRCEEDPQTGEILPTYDGPRDDSALHPKHFQMLSKHEFCPACVDLLDHFCKNCSVAGASEAANVVVHHFNLVSLIISAKLLQCSVCKMLLTCVEKLFPGVFEGRAMMQSYSIEVCWSRKPGPNARTFFFSIYKPAEPRHPSYNHTTVFQMYLWPADGFSQYFQPPSGVGQDDLAGQRELALHWVSRCDANADGRHALCKLPASDFVPSRLLNVARCNSTGLLRLANLEEMAYQESVEDQRYCTLSYNWGPNGALTQPLLKRDNLSSRSAHGLEMASLPNTFQDAVEVCSWFRIKYLWIDSLCIIQDDHEDWLKEAGRMSDTYRYAWLNLTSDAGSNSSATLFPIVDPPKKTWPQFESVDSQQSWTLTSSPIYLIRQMQEDTSFPRAWIYRERQLSRRILHFTSRGLTWECCAQGTSAPSESYMNESYASESFPGGVPFKSFLKETSKFQIGRFGKALVESDEETHATWNDVCETLSMKELTRESDRAIVLAGIAEEFSSLLPDDEYIAGLWRSTLPYSLLWKTRGSEREDVGGVERLGPSWSWLSVVQMVQLANRARVDRHAVVASIVDIRSSPDRLSRRYDPTTTGAMRVRGFLRRIRLRLTDVKRQLIQLSVLDEPTYERNDAADEEPRSKTRIWKKFGKAVRRTADVPRGSTKSWRLIGTSPDPQLGDLCELSLDDPRFPDPLDCYALIITIDQFGPSIPGNMNCLLLDRLDHDSVSFVRIGTMELAEEFALRMRYHLDKSDRRGWPDKHWAEPFRRLAQDEEQREEGERRNRKRERADSSLTGIDALYQFDNALTFHRDFPWLQKLQLQTIEIV